MKKCFLPIYLGITLGLTVVSNIVLADTNFDNESYISSAEISETPKNLGGGLRQLLAWQKHQQQHSSLQSSTTNAKEMLDKSIQDCAIGAQVDDDNRLVMRVRFDEKSSSETIKQGLLSLNGRIVNEYHFPSNQELKGGTFTVYLPLDQAVAASELSGVKSVVLIKKAVTKGEQSNLLQINSLKAVAGQIPPQGLQGLKANLLVEKGYNGKGITVGILSNSFDAFGVPGNDPAQTDIAQNNLPGPGNPAGFTDPVLVLEEGITKGATDEGRAIAQVVHSIAQGSRLAFATVGVSEEQFATNIRQLRTNSTYPCDIIVDDVSFFNEPFFSDGIVAQAVNDVVTQPPSNLAGKQVIYHTSAGNSASVGYDSNFVYADPVAGMNKATQLNWSQVPPEFYAGGFHNFKGAFSGEGLNIFQKVTVTGTKNILDFQWNDPYETGAVTTGYFLLVFDSNGNFQPRLSGIDDPFATNSGVQFAQLPLNNDQSTNYYLVIGRSANGTRKAKHFRYIPVQTGKTFTGRFLTNNVPTEYGHVLAENADSIAAFNVRDLNYPESFTSLGGGQIYFDSTGARLKTPINRVQPTLSGVDALDISNNLPALPAKDVYGEGFPQFFGTSCAAPSISGIAALFLQATGGPGTTNAAQMRAVFQNSCAAHDVDPSHSITQLQSPDQSVIVGFSASGDNTLISNQYSRFFKAAFQAPKGYSINSLTIDTSPIKTTFNPSLFAFTTFASGGLKPNVVQNASATSTDGGPLNLLQLTMRKTKFRTGGVLYFGIGREHGFGADQIGGLVPFGGAKITAVINLPNSSIMTLYGSMSNVIGKGYSALTGSGLVNGSSAFQLIQPVNP